MLNFLEINYQESRLFNAHVLDIPALAAGNSFSTEASFGAEHFSKLASIQSAPANLHYLSPV